MDTKDKKQIKEFPLDWIFDEIEEGNNRIVIFLPTGELSIHLQSYQEEYWDKIKKSK